MQIDITEQTASTLPPAGAVLTTADRPSDNWTAEDSAIAQSQGWDLFKASCGGLIVLLIERCDDREIFADDDQAIEHVRARAAEGDEVAAKALRLDHELKGQ